MFCYKCGHEAKEGERFCTECGAILNQSNKKMVKLTCEDCNGVLEIDASRTVLTCPYCGSKKLIPESDEVTIARINKEADLERMRHEREMKEYEEELRVKKDKEEQQKTDDDLRWVITRFLPGCVLFCVICFFLMYLMKVM